MTRDADVIVFAPHPDDEVIACGGTILNRVSAGMSVGIVFATDGSQSHNAVLGIADDPSPEELVAIRRDEAVAAAGALGVPEGRLTFVGAKDTRLVDSLDLLRDAVDRLLDETASLAEIYIPHPRRELNADHVLTGRIVLERLALRGLQPRIFQYVVWDAEVEADFGYTNRIGGQAGNGVTEMLHREDISDRLQEKFAAMLHHRTQSTLYSSKQQRAVVPPALIERVRTRPYEEFWCPAPGQSPADHDDNPVTSDIA